MKNNQLFKLPGVRLHFFKMLGYSGLMGLLIIWQADVLTSTLVQTWKLQIDTAWLRSMLYFLIAFSLRQVLEWWRQRQNIAFATVTVTKLQQQLLQHIAMTGPSLVANYGTGAISTLIEEGIDKISVFLQNNILRLADMSIIPWIILAYVYWKNWESGLILTLVFPLIIFFMIILGIAARKMSEAQYAGFNHLNNHFVDSIRGLETLKMLGISQKYGSSISSVSETYRKKTMSVLRVAFTSSFALDFFTTLSIAIEAVFLGIALINNTIVLAPALAVLIVSPDYFLPVRQYGEDYHANLDGKNALDEVVSLLKVPSLPSTYLKLPLYNGTSQLSFNHTLFSYSGVTDDINQSTSDISFSFEGFSKIGIVGPSGAGKSTLLNLIAGFLVPTGLTPTIKVNEKLVSHLHDETWQDQLAYLPQRPYLFKGTIRENIAFYEPSASLEAIQASAEQAGLARFLNSLPEGLDTIIGEGGRGLSGGQVQRIAIARALVGKNRPILLLDEPTAHLDIETEAALKKTLIPLFSQHLVIFATHRLHWLQQMDWIIVMNNGNIEAQGPYEKVIKNSPTLEKMQAAIKKGGHTFEQN